MNWRSKLAIYFLGLATFTTFLSAQLITQIVSALAKRLGAEDLSIAFSFVSDLFQIIVVFTVEYIHAFILVGVL